MTVRLSSGWRRPAGCVAAAILVLVAPGAMGPAFAAGSPDASYTSRHPRLLFSTDDLPLLRARIADGGADADAYAFIRSQFTDHYTGAPFEDLLLNDFGLEQTVNIGLAAWLEEPVDQSAIELGRNLTLHIARNWQVDTDPFGTSLRLRALAIGFDLFFEDATAAERQEVRDEAQAYIAYMTTNLNYDIWRRRPYVSNKSAMVAGAVGLAAIAFHEEIAAAYTGTALAFADDVYRAWRDAHLTDGSYREGGLYIGWSLRNLIYYFEARKRFDGFDYSLDPSIRAVEEWMPYELDPRGGARLNNIQDQTDYFLPLARHTTYWAWAQREWGSAIAAYVWEHAAGAFGEDLGDESDHAATVLWHTGVTPRNPGELLPASRVWPDRGLYYYRSGWPDGAASGDVAFSFYSGAFNGGHAQEDQNQFTLAAYGEKLILDHGAGSMAKQSEAHNIVRIDGAGQHNAGASIGTDGDVAAYITTPFADLVCGDATLAYTTHSPYNDAGVPYPWSNWSWGWSGANPVERALRRIVAVHDGTTPPYFVVQDDIRKDGNVHRYDWCVHVPRSGTVDAQAEPMTVETGAARLELHTLHPPRATLASSVSNFDNYSEDPDSRLLMLTANQVEPVFTVLLLPLKNGDPAPVVSTTAQPWGSRTEANWGGGRVDVVFARAAESPGAVEVARDVTAQDCAGSVSTDAVLGVVRTAAAVVDGYVLTETTSLSCGGEDLAVILDAPASLVYDGTRVHIDRADAHFRIRASGVSEVVCQGVVVPTALQNGYLVSAVASGAGPTPAPAALAVRAYPNPFNPSVRISFANPSRGRVDAIVYDAAGRRVATLVSRPMDAGEHTIEWNGRDLRGREAASGVYFLRVAAGGARESLKLVLLR